MRKMCYNIIKDFFSKEETPCLLLLSSQPLAKKGMLCAS